MDSSTLKPEVPRGLTVSFALALATILTVGTWFYHAEELRQREDVERHLAAIVKLKVDALTEWRHNACEDAAHVAENPMLVAALTRGLAGLPAPERDMLRAWMESFCKHSHYEDILLTDGAGQIQFSLAGQPRDLAPEEKDTLRQVLKDGAPRLSKLFPLATEHGPRLSVVASVRVSVAVQGVILVVDPTAYLFPLIQSWPVPSRTAETLLVRREGDQVLFLNELRHQPNTALQLTIPLTRSEVPAVMAVQGKQGVLQGVDYRGVPVLSAFAPVPDSPWFLVGKVDEAEALVAWREQSRLIIGLIALLILSMLLAGGGLWQRMQKRHYRTTLRVELERQALRKHFELFIRNANDIIVLSDGERKIIEANERALAAYGYTREEMIGMSVRKLIPDEDVDAFETRMQDLETHGEFRIEGIHLRKDGGRFPVEVSARVIEVEGRKFVQAITRDITERKAHLAEIERMNRLYLALSQVDQSIVRARTREELFAKMCRVLVEFGGFKLVWIGMVNPVTKQVEVAARHGEGQDYLDGIQIFADDRPEGRGPTGLAIRENRPVMANDFARDARTQPWQAAGAQVGIRSSAAFPLLLQQQACGALIVYASEPNFFREREIALLLEASIDISFAMEKLHEAEQHALLDAQLQASEAQFHTLFNSMQEMVVLHELVRDAAGQPVDYRILDCNPAFTSITGITRTRAVGALGSELYGIGQAPFLELYARVVQTGQPENIETFFAPLGKHFNLSALSYMPGRFATVTMDVTAHKQAETALRENERAHRTLLANLPGIAYRCQNQPDWPMDFISEGCRELLGYEVEQMLRGKPTFGSLIHPDDRRSVCDGVQASLQKGSVYNLEYRMRRADGSECWVLDRGRGVHDTDGKLLALEGIILDITARKAAEVALERSRGDWEHIFQAIGQPTAILDAEHNFLEANQALLQASGKTMAELRGLKCWHIFHGRDASKPVAECPMELALRSGKQEIAEVEVQTLGGIYLVSCTPVKNAAGQIEKIIHIATNITESKRLQQSFLQAQKMETVGKLAGGIAHDFNNILQTILGYSELLLKNTPPEDERHRDLEEIHRSGERAAGLTRQLLAFSRKQMLLPKVHDLNDIITNLGRMLIRLIGEDVDLKLELTPNIPRIRVDAGQIEQVLMNLAVNARDAMPKGGQLVIRTRSMVLTAEDLPMHPEGRPGQFVCLDVADNGGGMSLEVQAHIFEPFFTTKPQGKGTGLGLATVHGIIKQHEGWTTVYSESTLGTTFKIYLPAVTDADGAVDKILITPVPTGKNERILLIEDEPHVRRLAQLILSKNGYRVTAGGTCAEAQAAFDKHIDLVLSDVVLPDGNGLEMAQHFQSQRPGLRCVLTSGYADIHERWPAIEQHRWGFLPKPFSKADLLRAVATALAHT